MDMRRMVDDRYLYDTYQKALDPQLLGGRQTIISVIEYPLKYHFNGLHVLNSLEQRHVWHVPGNNECAVFGSDCYAVCFSCEFPCLSQSRTGLTVFRMLGPQDSE